MALLQGERSIDVDLTLFTVHATFDHVRFLQPRSLGALHLACLFSLHVVLEDILVITPLPDRRSLKPLRPGLRSFGRVAV